MRLEDVDHDAKIKPSKKLTLFIPLIRRDQPVEKGKRIEDKLQVNNTTQVMASTESLQ